MNVQFRLLELIIMIINQEVPKLKIQSIKESSEAQHKSIIQKCKT